jgi:hypothetical protein
MRADGRTPIKRAAPESAELSEYSVSFFIERDGVSS